MKKIIYCILISGLISCSKPSQEFYMPGEWEPHDAVWLGWEEDHIAYHHVVIDIVKNLTPHVKVKITVTNDSTRHVAKSILATNGLDTTRIEFITMAGSKYWIRDHGAAFLVNENGQLGMADFDWNNYGRPGWIKEKYNDNPDSTHKHITLRLARTKLIGQVDSLMAVMEGAKILKAQVKHEGGAIEVNGKGTLILCEATVLQRNPELTKEYIEREFRYGLGVTNIIWMKKGLADDPLHFFRRIADNYIGGGTGGHTDEFVRFSNPTTVMLAWVSEEEKDLNPINKMNYERMKDNFDILSRAKDQDGNPFTIVKVPLPDLITKKVLARKISDDDDGGSYDVDPSSFKASEAPQSGDTLLRVPASSYMNYLVTNGVVILPSYTQAGSSRQKEDDVKRIFQEQFPGREIIFMDAMPINWSGGGIHCSTQQQPRRRK
jgi:agmatine deiminase